MGVAVLGGQPARLVYVFRGAGGGAFHPPFGPHPMSGKQETGQGKKARIYAHIRKRTRIPYTHTHRQRHTDTHTHILRAQHGLAGKCSKPSSSVSPSFWPPSPAPLSNRQKNSPVGSFAAGLLTFFFVPTFAFPHLPPVGTCLCMICFTILLAVLPAAFVALFPVQTTLATYVCM